MSAILIVEDEKHLADGLRFNLEVDGYAVEIAGDGESALRLLLDENREYAAVVLDVMLPGLTGFEVAARLRSTENYTPILMLTARNRPEDVLAGFEAGADDYLPKPFELAIFLARLRGLLRRREWFRIEKDGTNARQISAKQFVINRRIIDFGQLEVRTANETLRLTLMEAKLLRRLMENAGEVVSRRTILEEVWDLHEDTDTRAVDNFIVRLRRYLEDDPAKPKHLLTVRGVGYRLMLTGDS